MNKKLISIVIAALLVAIPIAMWFFLKDDGAVREESEVYTDYNDFENATTAIEDNEVTPSEVVKTKSPEFVNFLSNVFTDESELVTCTQESNHRALVYTVNHPVTAEEKIDEIKFYPLLDWEPNILRDTAEWLLPTVGGGDLPLLEFRNYDDYTKVAYFQTGDTSGSIFYEWRLNYLIISTSLECLGEAGDYFYQF
jgi:hypothetical protein